MDSSFFGCIAGTNNQAISIWIRPDFHIVRLAAHVSNGLKSRIVYCIIKIQKVAEQKCRLLQSRNVGDCNYIL